MSNVIRRYRLREEPDYYPSIYSFILKEIDNKLISSRNTTAYEILDGVTVACELADIVDFYTYKHIVALKTYAGEFLIAEIYERAFVKDGVVYPALNTFFEPVISSTKTAERFVAHITRILSLSNIEKELASGSHASRCFIPAGWILRELKSRNNWVVPSYQYISDIISWRNIYNQILGSINVVYSYTLYDNEVEEYVAIYSKNKGKYKPFNA